MAYRNRGRRRRVFSRGRRSIGRFRGRRRGYMKRRGGMRKSLLRIGYRM